MPVIGLRQLHRETGDVIERLEEDGEVIVVTRHGKPIAELRPVSDEQAAGYALAMAPEFVASRERAAEAIAAGEGEPASQVLAEFEAEDDDEPEVNLFDVEIVFPKPVLARIARRVAVTSAGAEIASAAPIENLNAALFSTLARDSLVAAAEKVRRVNENIVVNSGESISVEHYVSELSRVIESERLSARTAFAPPVAETMGE